MPPDRFLKLSLAGLVILGLLAMPASAVAQQPFDRLVCGTWLFQITIPPNPLLGNPQAIQMPEYATFGIAGAGFHVAGALGFPVPVNGNIVNAIVTNGAGSWQSDGRSMTATVWRFVLGPDTGEFLGFFKITLDVGADGRDRLEGQYVLELLDPQLAPMTLGGQDLVLGGAVTADRVAVERFSRR